MKILVVGIATVDIISEVACYPREDDEVRAEGLRLVRGGNGTNTLVVLSQLGHHGVWAGTLADDLFASLIREDLKQYHIDLSPVVLCAGSRSPVSCIVNSQASASRTIVHDRQLPEYEAKAFMALHIKHYDWIHFEGRNITQTALMLRHAASMGVLCSLEIEKDRPGIESLIALSGLVLFSKQYALCQGYTAATDFLLAYQVEYPQKVMVCAWGADGAFGIEPGKAVVDCPSNPVDAVDTVGAGDVFNAAFIHAYQASFELTSALAFACRLAERHCCQTGFVIDDICI